MFNHDNTSMYELVKHALKRIIIIEHSNQESFYDSRKDDYVHVPFNILKYIDGPY